MGELHRTWEKQPDPNMPLAVFVVVWLVVHSILYCTVLYSIWFMKKPVLAVAATVVFVWRILHHDLALVAPTREVIATIMHQWHRQCSLSGFFGREQPREYCTVHTSTTPYRATSTQQSCSMSKVS